MVSIKDVAVRAGVSIKTVSRVVNREPSVRPETREEVQAAIEALGYLPHLGARSIRTNRTGVIGLITDVVATTPYSVDIIRGVQDAITKAGRTLLMTNTAGDAEKEQESWRLLQEHRIDGVLFATMYHRPVELHRGAASIKTVLLNCFAPLDPEIPSVVPDDYQGAFDAVEYAIAAGHRAIAYVTLNPIVLPSGLRLAAYRDALARHGLPIHPEFIRPGIIGDLGREEMVTFDAVIDLLKRPDRPTAIVCGNDEIALQAMCAVASLNLRIPDDVAIIGFDDLKIISEVVRPSLTTVSLPYYDLGRTGVEILVATIDGQDPAPGTRRMRCSLVARRSA